MLVIGRPERSEGCPAAASAAAGHRRRPLVSKTVGKNERIIQEYIKNQLQEDSMNDQISMKEYIDPFTGSKNK